MIRILLCGCGGRMGRVIAEMAEGQPDIAIVAGCDKQKLSAAFPVYENLADCTVEADVLVDFSHTSALPDILAYCEEKGLPAVLCSTGYSEEDLARIREASEKVPLFRSANMSIGINLLSALVRRAAEILGEGFDIEILEKHHNQKLDAPSGTALMLADAARDGLSYEPEYVYDRHAVRKKRDPHEIGLHAVRGGTIVGEHDVIFAGTDEVITLSHSAQSRSVFAAGALRAARYLAGVTEPGLYNMDDVIASL
ncbi:MAG: 4-hydroxy-tetrahydrodipicolinate reductase [Clostridia bacterium]|nr:4-hydroxy-tetrahydrodipicolinate reductase [Clostridia bacterium]